MRMTKNRRQVLDMLSSGDSISSKDLLPLLSRQARFNVLDRMWCAGLIADDGYKDVEVTRKDGEVKHFDKWMRMKDGEEYYRNRWVRMKYWVIANRASLI